MKILNFFLMLLIVVLIPIQAASQNNLLGKIDFPNSGAPNAQADFMEGILFLHNFEYEDAARAFRRAQQKDPDFVMAYYGEAKTHNHPIWMEQDTEAGIAILEELGESYTDRQSKAKTQREKDYLHTLEVLYGTAPKAKDRSKEERDDLYREAMKQLHKKYPDDHEVTAFYGLSILGTAHEGRDYAIYMQAAAELMDVWNQNKKHPGAAHYLIHSFDDPVHAPLGLPMAKAYAEIAPGAAHAQHMTSHIFLALGMWDDVVDANIVARDVQTTRQKELDEQTTVCGHYPWWLQYGYLQNGEIQKAEKVLKACYERVNGDHSGNMYGELWHFSVMRGHQVIDSENWDLYDRWTADISTESAPGRNYYFTSAFAALKTGNLKQAQNHLEKLKSVDVSDERNEATKRDIQVMQIEGMILASSGDYEKATAILKEAAELESGLPVSFGPPTIVKPSYELLGDVFMETGNIEQAMKSYGKQLERTPERRRSLLAKEKALGMAEN